MTGVSSDAAVASVKAPLTLLKSDPLLTLILSIAPQHQITINAAKKGSTLSLTTQKDDFELTQRNTILRNICGMIFHNALDKHPHYLLGGHSASGRASSESALALASVSSYMSIASSIRMKNVDLSLTYQQLNQVLECNAYLVGSTPKATLGDLDVFFALMEVSAGTISDLEKYTHLKRWLGAVSSTVHQMVDSCPDSPNMPDITVPTLDVLKPDAPTAPFFYYGEEDDIDQLLTPTSSAPVALESASATSAAQSNASKKNTNNAPTGGSGNELTDEQKKAAADKRAKKAAAKAEKKKKTASAEPAAAAESNEINASALDVRVGKIIEVWEHEESDKLWCEKVDLGDKEPRQILSGLRKFYKKEDMQDARVLVLCNLKKRNLVGVPSHGMVLCASNADHTEVEFVIPPEGAKIGERVMFEGYDGDAVAENKFAKKKMLVALAPDLKTDDDGVVVWKGAKSVTSAGPCVASKSMKGAQVS